MALKIQNNAISKLAVGLATNDITLTLTAGDGARFPSLAAGDWFPLTLIKSDGTYEIVKATARNNDSLTIVRGQEATTASIFNIGDRVELRLTAAAIQSMIDAAIQAQATADSKLDATAKAVDADKLDGHDATEFLLATAQAADAAKLGGKSPTDYLAATAPATDSAKLGGQVPGFYAVPAGAVAHFAMQAPPDGWLKANGSAVLRATYPALDTAIYCGDTKNTTAAFGYRCVDPGNPNGSRSTVGTYIVLPDLRGEFVRGFDDARGIDAGRAFGSWQADDLKSHAHNYTGMQITGNWAQGGSRDALSPQTQTTAAAGGSETRPRNVALLACIKY